MIQRRQFIAGAAGAAAIPLLGSAAAPALAQGQPATLRFSWWGGNERHQLTLKAIELFEQKNPGIKIKAEYGGFQGYLERLTTQIAGGSEPDVMQSDWAWLTMFSRNGDGFLDLNTQSKVLSLSEFQDDALRMGTIKGKLNALPASFTARVFVWNKTAFDKAGLKIPTTWDEFFALGPQVQAKLGDKGYVLDGDSLDTLLLAHSHVLQKHGQPYVHLSEPKVAMSLEALKDWVSVYKRLTANHVMVPQPYRTALGGADKPTEQQPDWVNGNWLGYCAWDSATRLRVNALAQPQQAMVGDYLSQSGAKASGMTGRAAMVFAVSKRTPYPEQAARFINFLLTDVEAGRILINSRGIPMAQSQLKELLRTGRMGPSELQAFQQVKVAREAGRVLTLSPLFENARVAKLVRDIFDQVAYDKIGVDAAAQRLLEEGNATLSRIRT
jgi:oligogalacturonide transport system substrate-binding protein